MGLNLKRDTALPYPFNLRTKPSRCWEVLDDSRLSLHEPVVMLVFKTKLVVSIPFRQLLTISHYVPDQILIQFTTHEVRIHGEWMTELYLTLLAQQSCVVYEWRKNWGKAPVKAEHNVREILLRPIGSEPVKEEEPTTPNEADELH